MQISDHEVANRHAVAYPEGPVNDVYTFQGRHIQQLGILEVRSYSDEAEVL